MFVGLVNCRFSCTAYRIFYERFLHMIFTLKQFCPDLKILLQFKQTGN